MPLVEITEEDKNVLALMRNVTEEFLLKRIHQEEVLMGIKSPRLVVYRSTLDKVNKLYEKSSK